MCKNKERKYKKERRKNIYTCAFPKNRLIYHYVASFCNCMMCKQFLFWEWVSVSLYELVHHKNINHETLGYYKHVELKTSRISEKAQV